MINESALHKLRIWLLIVWVSFKSVFRINLGDQVVYKGKKYTVCNCAKCDVWRLAYLDNGYDGWVSRNECKKVWSLNNLRWSFQYNYDFYMGHWFKLLTERGA